MKVIFYFVLHRWFSRCAIQGRGQELVDGLKACLQSKGRLSALVESDLRHDSLASSEHTASAALRGGVTNLHLNKNIKNTVVNIAEN